jgi:protein subunit release factor B
MQAYLSKSKRDQLQDFMKRMGVLDKDLTENFILGSGKGGQKVNKTSSCVNLKHIPTALSVKMQKARTQILNRYYARKRMCELLEETQLGNQSPKAKLIEKIRKQKARKKRRSASH